MDHSYFSANTDRAKGVAITASVAPGPGPSAEPRPPAIDPAEDADQSRAWLHAASEVTRALIKDRSHSLLDGIVHVAREVSRSDHCGLLLPTEDGGMRVVLADGAAAHAYLGHVFDPDSGQLGPIIRRGRSLRVEHISAMATREYPPGFAFGPAMLTPLIDQIGIRGALLFLRDEGGSPYTETDLDLATTFATQVALGLELADARMDAESLRVLQDRHRIAKDLHDNVMQRLFAAGLTLQMIDIDGVPTAAAQRLQQHMTDLDDTIRQIRTTIFELRESEDVSRLTDTHFPRIEAAVAARVTDQAQ